MKKGGTPSAIQESRNLETVKKDRTPSATQESRTPGAVDAHGQAFCGLSACCGEHVQSRRCGVEEGRRRSEGVEEEDRRSGESGRICGAVKNRSGCRRDRSRRGTRSLPCGTLFF